MLIKKLLIKCITEHSPRFFHNKYLWILVKFFNKITNLVISESDTQQILKTRSTTIK